MVRRVTGRPASRFLIAILLTAQLVGGPFAYAASTPPMAVGCDPVAAAEHASIDSMVGCDHCPGEQSPAPAGSHAGQHHCCTHAACSYSCAHAPALGAAPLVTLTPVPPMAVAGVLAAGTFDPPLFDFLRPPN
jgi:hypothetical protein